MHIDASIQQPSENWIEHFPATEAGNKPTTEVKSIENGGIELEHYTRASSFCSRLEVGRLKGKLDSFRVAGSSSFA